MGRSRSDVRRVTALLALVVLAAFAAGVWNLYATRRQLREESLAFNVSTSRIAVETISANLEVQRNLLEAVAQSLLENVRAGDWSQVAADLRFMREIDPRIVRAALLDRDGIVRVSSSGDEDANRERVGDDESRCDCFVAALEAGGAYLSRSLDTAAGAPHMVLSSAVRDEAGSALAVVIAEIPVSNLGLLTESLVNQEFPGSVNVFTDRGVQLTGVTRPGPEHVGYEVFRQASGRASGTLQGAVPGRVRDRLIAFESVSGTNWVVVVEQPAGQGGIVEATGRLVTFGAFINLILIAGAVIAIRLFRQLEQERVRSSSILDSIPDGAVTTDAAGVVTSVNPAMERLAGWSSAEVLTRPFADVYPLLGPGDHPVDWRGDFLDKVVRSNIVATSRGYDLGLRTRDGRTLPVSHMLAPILGRDGDLVGCVAVVRDVTYEKELDQMKSSLISTVSHELRTPLTMIQGFSELLLQRTMNPEREREALSRINASSERLARLIDDLLSVSRIESGRLVVRAAPTDLREVADEVVLPFGEKRDATVAAGDPLPLVMADRDMVVQILTNLVSNAVKYSAPDAPVRVTFGVSGDSVTVTVEDRGIGLTREELGKLFQKFARADRKEVREIGGTGLGLYITKSLVEMQGGRIWAESEPGRGSRFSFSLPTARSAAVASSPDGSPDGRRSRISVPSTAEQVERPPGSRQRRDA
ncbi:MAG: sensor histidine kinase [Actinomycetota bacterium]